MRRGTAELSFRGGQSEGPFHRPVAGKEPGWQDQAEEAPGGQKLAQELGGGEGHGQQEELH